MMMSVFRQGEAARNLDHLACMDLAVDAEAAKMILHASMHAKAVLIGLDGHEAIVKPLEPGDDRLSFEHLYDTALSIREFRLLGKHKVKSTEDIPPALYEVDLILTAVGEPPTVTVQFPAKRGHQNTGHALHALMNNPEFRIELVRRFVTQMMEAEGTQVRTHGVVAVEDTAPPGLTWEFLDED